MPEMQRSLSVRAAVVVPLLLAVALTAACGRNLSSLTSEAMDGCIAARNPAFKGGSGATALSSPLPDSTAALSRKLAYDRAFKVFRDIATNAKDQVTLVCALELGAHYRHGDVAVLLWQFSKHPDSAVSINARKLLQSQDPLPKSYAP